MWFQVFFLCMKLQSTVAKISGRNDFCMKKVLRFRMGWNRCPGRHLILYIQLRWHRMSIKDINTLTQLCNNLHYTTLYHFTLVDVKKLNIVKVLILPKIQKGLYIMYRHVAIGGTGDTCPTPTKNKARSIYVPYIDLCSIYLSICPSIHLSTYLQPTSIHPFIPISVQPSILPSICKMLHLLQILFFNVDGLS